jgi:hypothetical protein
MKHLTHTGYFAGKPLCGAARESSEVCEHAVYVRLESRERIKSFCNGCLATWLAFAYDGDDLPNWPVSIDDIAEIEKEIPHEFASDSEVKSFREKLRAWKTCG